MAEAGPTLDTTAEDLQDLTTSSPVKTNTKSWGRLCSLDSNTASNVEFTTDVIQFGRHKDFAPECRFSDKRISLKHCKIWKDVTGVWIEDTSSNGTYVNGVKIGKGKKVQIQHGDEVSLASAPEKPNQTNIRYMFQNAEIIKERKDSLHNSQGALSRNNSVELKPSSQESHHHETKPSSQESSSSSSSSNPSILTKKTSNGNSTTTTVTITTTTSAGDNKKKDDDDDDNAASKIEPSDPDDQGKRKLVRSESDVKKRAKLEKLEEIYEDNLMCGICHELLYKCVTVIPCLHNFCAACLSEWFERSKQCPTCRDESQSVRKNHNIANLVESYLEANPDKKRDPEELKEMDAKNKITDEMLRPAALRKKKSYNDYDEDEDDEYNSDDDDDDGPAPVHFAPFGGYHPVPALPIFNWNTCRQCNAPGPDGFKCNANFPVHLTCSRCNEKLPNRPDCPTPVRCEICKLVFCDVYWGCKSPLGQGALKQLKTWSFPNLPLNSMNGNNYERTVLQNYLDAKGKTVNAAYQEILAGLDTGKFKHAAPIKSTSHTCHACATNVFGALCYDYRASIPSAEFPESVRRRNNCHYGKNCRTQKTKEDHAKRFNHICEQIKFD
eukprot:TRINITY_DN6185_c0_g1_i1.p1 TRINITY_DN6185_c0_g1~~TRINITY_DN6185_c0_g1_i1.p1  ORF type:complete len:610 (-),score=108.48 TRINITY_DN6185_c0_g1_i1:60-1889(-)